MDTGASTRGRLLHAAAELFYAQGITATGVDAIALHAGVTKPTLYAHFRSKDALVAAVLEHRHAQRVEMLEQVLVQRAKDPREQLLVVFDWLAELHATESARGCAFVNAAAEIVGATHPARAVVCLHKRWMRQYLGDLADRAGCAAPQRLGSDLMLLFDGANVRMLIEGDLDAASDARRIAAVLIESPQVESPQVDVRPVAPRQEGRR